MKLSKDEIIKKLAEGIKNTYISHHSECCIHCNIYDDNDSFIRDDFGFYHRSDCPVLLAEKVLKEIKCEYCFGEGFRIDGIDLDDMEADPTCAYCNGTGVKK
jgi:hypothetical protein